MTTYKPHPVANELLATIKKAIPKLNNVQFDKYHLDFEELLLKSMYGQPIVNAAAGEIDNKPIISISDDFIDYLVTEPDQLAMIIGHECGHIYYNHHKQPAKSALTKFKREKDADRFSGYVLELLGMNKYKAIKAMDYLIAMGMDNTWPYPTTETRIRLILGKSICK